MRLAILDRSTYSTSCHVACAVRKEVVSPCLFLPKKISPFIIASSIESKMSSLPAIGGRHKEVAIKPEHVASSSSGCYPVKSEEVATDNEEDTNASKNKHQYINNEHHRVKVEVKTEDDDISTDDEGISNNNESTVELQSPQLADT